MDWYSRKVLAWQLSNTLDHQFCVEALDEALSVYGSPEIFNSDQGRQFSASEFTDRLDDKDIQISMDGKGRWIDNRFIERLWRSLKYEEVYLKGYDSVREAERSIGEYFDYYNRTRPHSAHGGATPEQAYTGQIKKKSVA